MEDRTHCLGLEILGDCLYNPENPIVYFRMGQLLTLFAISFTIYNILNPITVLRIKASWLFREHVFFRFNWFMIMIGFSILSVFYSNILPILPKFFKAPVIGYPIFWESLSFLLLLTLAWAIHGLIRGYAKFSRDNSKHFLFTTLDIISEDVRSSVRV